MWSVMLRRSIRVWRPKAGARLTHGGQNDDALSAPTIHGGQPQPGPQPAGGVRPSEHAHPRAHCGCPGRCCERRPGAPFHRRRDDSGDRGLWRGRGQHHCDGRPIQGQNQFLSAHSHPPLSPNHRHSGKIHGQGRRFHHSPPGHRRNPGQPRRRLARSRESARQCHRPRLLRHDRIRTQSDQCGRQCLNRQMSGGFLLRQEWDV